MMEMVARVQRREVGPWEDVALPDCSANTEEDA